MGKKNGLKVLVGLSMLAGVTGSVLFKKQQRKRVRIGKPVFEHFQGQWCKKDDADTQLIFLSISSEGEFFLNQKELAGKIIHATDQKLVFEDSFGYQLVLELTAPGELTLYDDAEEQDYFLEKIVDSEEFSD